jgi:hypothetical protein
METCVLLLFVGNQRLQDKEIALLADEIGDLTRRRNEAVGASVIDRSESD